MLLVTIPHSGERIPEQAEWLKVLTPRVLLADVDRFVDELYAPVLDQLSIPRVIAPYHRYAVDLNRDPQDVDQSSVEGATIPAGPHIHGFHWVTTMSGDVILPKPMNHRIHQSLKELIYDPFHAQIAQVLQCRPVDGSSVWILDLHSMPSVGGPDHRDPGERRADVVISDNLGAAADPRMVDAVLTAFLRAGFKVAYNWPYVGGKMTVRYGRPHQARHAVQIELNRALYMDEVTKEKKLIEFSRLQSKLQVAMFGVYRAYQALAKEC